VDPGWERGWVTIGIETCKELALSQNINNSHCFVSHEHSISQFKTKEEINISQNINNSHCFVSHEHSISQFKTKEEINVTMDTCHCAFAL